MEERIRIGKITSFHGVKGYVKMYPYVHQHRRVETLKHVYIEDLLCSIEDIKLSGGQWLLKLEGLDSREDAREVMGKEITIPESERFPLPDGHYYVDDMVGMAVYEAGGGFLGTITDVLTTGANDIYIISCPKDEPHLPREILFPALKHLVESISMEEKKMVVRIPEGLF